MRPRKAHTGLEHPCESDISTALGISGVSREAELVTKPSAANRVRSRCRATTKLGVPCRATAIENGLCVMHSGRIDAREIGKKGGRARGKGKRGSFRAAAAGLLERDPDRYAAELLNSGAAGFKLASDLLEKEEAKAETERSQARSSSTSRW